METRTNWGIVAVAMVFALLAIGVAVFASYQRSDEAPRQGGALVAAQGSTDGTASTEWRMALSAIAESIDGPVVEYRAPEELGTTQTVGQELLATYAKLKSENKLNTPDADLELKALINRNITPLAPNDPYTLASVKVNQTTTLDLYAESVGNAMERSASVREYELASFARTVGVENFRGTPELRAAASIYRTIEHELIAAETPPALAEPHLAVVKSIAFLAQSTELMAGWSGDPLDALTYVDAFVKAERETQAAFNTLFTAMIAFGKQS